MTKKPPCACGMPYMAKGLCRKCYMNRYHIKYRRACAAHPMRSEAEDSIYTMRLQLSRAREIYAFAIGVPLRLRWRAEILKLQNCIASMECELSQKKEKRARNFNDRRGGHNAKWRADVDTNQILSLHNAGKNYREIGDIVGLSRRAVGDRINRHNEERYDAQRQSAV